MYPYIFTYIISCLFAGMADYNYHSKRKFVFYSVLALFVGAVLAGIRDFSVGTDVMVYGNNVFKAALRNNNLIDFLTNYRVSSGIEPLYLLLNFVVTRFTADVHWFYFVLQLLTITFVYVTLVEIKKRYGIDLWLSLLVYYTLFYPFSLNGMRQALAMSIVLVSWIFMMKRRLVLFIIVICLASGLHYSAIVFLLIYPMYRLLEKNKNKKMIVGTMVVCFLGVAVFNQFFIRIIAGFIPKYSRYLTGNGFDLSLNPIILRAPIIIVFMVFYRKYKTKNNQLFDFFLVMLFADAILSLLRGVIPTLYRLSMYFGMIKIVAYPYTCVIFNRNSKKVVKTMLVMMLFIIWYYQIIIQGNEEVYPYATDIITWIK